MDIKQIIADHAKWLANPTTGRRANLAHANLAHANLAYANLAGANLAYANLAGASLDHASLDDANLAGATLPAGVPIVLNIDAAILAAIGEDASGLDMKDWHCGTTHCRAGWPVKLAGEAGAKLERRFGTGAAGALIYAASRPGMPVPNFFASNADALADLRKCAEMAEGQTP